MLKLLNLPIALSIAIKTHLQPNLNIDSDRLPKELLLCKGQWTMLMINLWIQAGLVNGSLGEVVDIVYTSGCKPPELPLYVVVQFDNYSGPSWDQNDPKSLPITPITLGNHRQIPLSMSWALTIHKSQGLTLQKTTIDIGSTERQGLTFTVISRVKSLENLRIEPPFSFERYSRMKNNPYTIIRKKEESRLQQLSL
jgi:ATP-dependent exoDNAse (exonuclease V) alpha subunit